MTPSSTTVLQHNSPTACRMRQPHEWGIAFLLRQPHEWGHRYIPSSGNSRPAVCGSPSFVIIWRQFLIKREAVDLIQSATWTPDHQASRTDSDSVKPTAGFWRETLAQPSSYVLLFQGVALLVPSTTPNRSPNARAISYSNWRDRFCHVGTAHTNQLFPFLRRGLQIPNVPPRHPQG